MLFLLLQSGDVETNPGPNTRSENVLDIDSLPENPAEQMKAMFKLLKDIHSRSLQSSKVQTELAADVKAIKNGQKNIETKITGIQKRLDELEEKSKDFDQLGKDLSEVHASLSGLTHQSNNYQTRFDEIEDRSRRDNLIFHGIADAK